MDVNRFAVELTRTRLYLMRLRREKQLLDQVLQHNGLLLDNLSEQMEVLEGERAAVERFKALLQILLNFV